MFLDKRIICTMLALVLLLNIPMVSACAEELVPEKKTVTAAPVIAAKALTTAETTGDIQTQIPEPANQTLNADTLPEAELCPETAAEATEQEISAEAKVLEMPQFFQNDYPDTRFGYGTVSTSGCSITSLAMVASYLTGHTYYPDELADYFGAHGANNMERLEYASDMLQLPWKKAKNVHEVFAAVKEGSVAILLMNSSSMFTDSQHFIVVKGLTEDGKYLVNDPNSFNYEYWSLRQGFKTGFRDGELICGYSGGWIYDVSAMPEEPFIYVERKEKVEPRYPQIQLTPEEYQLLAEVIWVEARGEPLEGQQAIAEVVLNRMKSEDFPNSLTGVIYAEGQFRSTQFIEDADPYQAQYDAIDDALAGPYVLPEDVFYFATYPVNDNVWGEIGGHVFCYQWDK